MFQFEKIDNRVRFTRECVFTALDKLMNRKSFETITVNELVEVSGISRATFYRNYNSKEEIIEKKLNQVIKDSFKELTSEYKGITLNEGDVLNIFFIIIKENESLLECIKNARMDSVILKELSKILTWYANTYYKEHIKDDTIFDYIIGLVSGAIWNTISTWIEKEKKETPEELTKILVSFFTEVSYVLVGRDNN